MKVSHSFQTQFHTLKRYEGQELNVLLQGEASEVTGVSLTNTVSGTTFFGHTVDEATSELAKSSISTEELSKGDQIDLSHLDKDYQLKIRKLIRDYQSIFTCKQNMVGCFTGKSFSLKFSGTFPSANYSMKYSPDQLEVITKEINELEHTGIIRQVPCDGTALMPIFCVGKNKGKMNLAQ